MEECVRILKTMQFRLPSRTKEETAMARVKHLPNTLKNLERAGITLEDLDQLSVIHVSGTKGKGSTCAFVESILRTCGYKTGFFSSPHLVDWRERIRINGRPISREKFVSTFWELYNRFIDTQGVDDGGMPPFFRMLFFMAVKAFMEENVDVAIIEVGIGGQYDSTNIIRSPVVCGTTSLDLDHTHLLGNTIEEIAWNKAGIFKRGVPAFTVPQPAGAMTMLLDVATERGALLRRCPELTGYDWGGAPVILGIHGNVQRMNASLALQLCHTWIRDHEKPLSKRLPKYTEESQLQGNTVELADTFELSSDMIKGLKDCTWPGRTQTISRGHVTYYLDGAHTPESMQLCADWFRIASAQESQKVGGPVGRVLVFNATGIRDSLPLLQALKDLHFHVAMFCTNYDNKFQASKAASQEEEIAAAAQQRCQHHKALWDSLGETPSSDCNIIADDSGNTPCRALQNGTNKASSNVSVTFPCIEEAFQWAVRGRDPDVARSGDSTESGCPVELPVELQEASHVQVLCTGSLHLVGGCIRVIDPSFSDKTT